MREIQYKTNLEVKEIQIYIYIYIVFKGRVKWNTFECFCKREMVH